MNDDLLKSLKLFESTNLKFAGEQKPGDQWHGTDNNPPGNKVVGCSKGTTLEDVLSKKYQDLKDIHATEKLSKDVAEVSDPSGMMHAARHYNKSFIITAKLAEGGTKKYRIHAQSERVAREKFSQHYNMAKILTVEEEGVAEGNDGYDDESTRDEYMNLQSGNYVRDTQDSSGEVFIMRGQPDDRRVRIEDKDGRGWNIAPYRLVAVDPDDAAIGHYFNSMAEAKADPLGAWIAHKNGTEARKFKTREGAKKYVASHEGFTVSSSEAFHDTYRKKKVQEVKKFRTNYGWAGGSKEPQSAHAKQVAARRKEYEKGLGKFEPTDNMVGTAKIVRDIARSNASPEHKKAAIDALNKKGVAEAPGDFGLGANYRAVPDAEMQDLMGRSKNKTKTKRDKFDYPYIHGSNIQVKDEGGKSFDSEALKKSIMVRPGRILGQNAKMQHSETGTEAIFDIGLPALKGLAVNEKTGEFVVVDTCPGAGACKTFCYAMKGSYVMFKAVSMGLARMLNFLLNDPTGFASQLNAEIAAAKSKMAKKNAKVVVRWHDAGDFFSAEYLDMAYGVANANPDVGFYAYTKMADVATGQRPKNFNMNFSGGALSSQEKKIDFQRVKHSKVVPKDMFFDLIARDGTSLKKDAKGRMQFASPENLDQFKSIMAQKYAIDKNSILTYDEMMKTPVGDTPKWNTIVMPGDGDNSANRNDVIGSYLLFH